MDKLVNSVILVTIILTVIQNAPAVSNPHVINFLGQIV